MSAYTYDDDDDGDWKDNPVLRYVISTVGGIIMNKTVKKVMGKVQGQVRQVDLNNLIANPKEEAKALGERLKKEGEESLDSMKKEVEYVKKKGLAGIVKEKLRHMREDFVGRFVGLVEQDYALTSELKVEGIDILIGEYLNDDRPMKRERADRVRYFARELLLSEDIVPQTLGYGVDDPYVRKQLITDFVGYATTDVEFLAERLEAGTTIDRIVLKDDDPSLRKWEFEVLCTYKEELRSLSQKYDAEE